jgi:Laminin G domain
MFICNNNTNDFQNSFQMSNGKIQLHWQSTIHVLESEPLNNGKWHFLEIKWMQGEVWLSVDNGYYEKTVAVDTKLQGLSVIKVSVGGLEGTRTTDSLVGCIKVKYLFTLYNKPLY